MSTKDNDPAQDPHKTLASTGDSTVSAATTDADMGTSTAAEGTSETAPAVNAATAADAAEPVPEQGEVSAAAADIANNVEQVEQAGQVEAAGEAADESADIAELPGQLPGDVLAARRQEMRLSIEELAARVKLAPRQLIALEANDFGSLPGMATTRGFIRSCAKALSLDPEPLLAMVAHEPNPALGAMVMRRPLPQPGFNGRRYAPSTSHRRGANKLSGLAAVVLIFVGMLAYVAWRNDWLQMPDIDFAAARDAVMPSFSSNVQPEPQVPAEEPADTASNIASTTETNAADHAAGTPPASKPTGVSAAPKAAVTASADAEVYAPSAPASAKVAAPAAVTMSKATTVDAARALELKLREDAWVEVLTQNGERKLVSRLMKAGSTERIEVTEPVILIVGNAAGVDVMLRGQPVSLKAGTRDNVAKINLK